LLNQSIKQLTANVNLQFAEACYHVCDGKLHDEVSVSRYARGTLQVRKHYTGVVGNTGVLRYTAG